MTLLSNLRWASFFRLVLVLATVIPTVQFSSASAKESFEGWKKSFLKRYGYKEVPRKFMAKQLDGIEPAPRVIEIDRNQVTHSKKLDYQKWMKGWLDSDPKRVERGRELLVKHKSLLDRIEKKYGVDREAILALWGVETLYGTSKGKYPVIQALSTLAHEGRRRKFFERELFTAIKIIYQGHVTRDGFLGSWSGASGHCQFMPSSFMRRAVDFDGDGKKDIWNNTSDGLASIANYLKKAKWKKGKDIGYLVFLGEGAEIPRINPKRRLSASHYRKLGFKFSDGRPVDGSWKRRAAPIPHKNSPFVLRGPNYMSVLRWNNSSFFAALNITLMEKLQQTSRD